MKDINHPQTSESIKTSAHRYAMRRNVCARYLIATLLALLASTSLAHAGWSTVNCADGEEMCCWVEDGVESNCHEGACHTLQGNPGNEVLEEFERNKDETSNETTEVDQADAEIEDLEEYEARPTREPMEVSSADGQVFCIDLITMRAIDGPCPGPKDEDDDEHDDEDPTDTKADTRETAGKQHQLKAKRRSRRG